MRERLVLSPVARFPELPVQKQPHQGNNDHTQDGRPVYEGGIDVGDVFGESLRDVVDTVDVPHAEAVLLAAGTGHGAELGDLAGIVAGG